MEGKIEFTAATTSPVSLKICNPKTIHFSFGKINKPNWEEFKIQCNKKMRPEQQKPNNKNLTKHFAETLISIGKETTLNILPPNKRDTP